MIKEASQLLGSDEHEHEAKDRLEKLRSLDRQDNPSLLEEIIGTGVATDKKDNDRLLLQSLDEVIDDLLGKRVRVTFYDYMERNYYFGRDDIPQHLGDFLLVLERTFGKSGKTIERAIAKRLCSKLSQK
jgi:hypothetical protein